MAYHEVQNYLKVNANVDINLEKSVHSNSKKQKIAQCSINPLDTQTNPTIFKVGPHSTSTDALLSSPSLHVLIQLEDIIDVLNVLHP